MYSLDLIHASYKLTENNAKLNPEILHWHRILYHRIDRSLRFLKLPLL